VGSAGMLIHSDDIGFHLSMLLKLEVLKIYLFLCMCVVEETSIRY
jgi:hypothetical protein